MYNDDKRWDDLALQQFLKSMKTRVKKKKKNYYDKNKLNRTCS